MIRHVCQECGSEYPGYYFVPHHNSRHSLARFVCIECHTDLLKPPVKFCLERRMAIGDYCRSVDVAAIVKIGDTACGVSHLISGGGHKLDGGLSVGRHHTSVSLLPAESDDLEAEIAYYYRTGQVHPRATKGGWGKVPSDPSQHCAGASSLCAK